MNILQRISLYLALRRADKYLAKHRKTDRSEPANSIQEREETKSLTVVKVVEECKRCQQAEKLESVQRILRHWPIEMPAK